MEEESRYNKYVKKYQQENKEKVNKYQNEYKKKNYSQKKVELKQNEIELLNKILEYKGVSFKEYVMNHVIEDFKNL